YTEEIMKAWMERMKETEEEHFFHYMQEHLIEKTSREFTDLMLSKIESRTGVDVDKSIDFTSKIVHYGWSIKFVNKAVDSFSTVAFEFLEKEGIIHAGNLRTFFDLFMNWIEPLRESIIDSYSAEWERTVNLQRVALQELSASLIPVFDKISVMPLVGTIDTERAKLIMENLLEGVVEQRAEVVLLDITGVPVFDTMV